MMGLVLAGCRHPARTVEQGGRAALAALGRAGVLSAMHRGARVRDEWTRPLYPHQGRLPAPRTQLRSERLTGFPLSRSTGRPGRPKYPRGVQGGRWRRSSLGNHAHFQHCRCPSAHACVWWVLARAGLRGEGVHLTTCFQSCRGLFCCLTFSSPYLWPLSPLPTSILLPPTPYPY